MTKVWLWDEHGGEGNAISTDVVELTAHVKENWFGEEEADQFSIEKIDDNTIFVYRDGDEIGVIKVVEQVQPCEIGK
jgi:hypothetical protein